MDIQAVTIGQWVVRVSVCGDSSFLSRKQIRRQMIGVRIADPPTILIVLRLGGQYYVLKMHKYLIYSLLYHHYVSSLIERVGVRLLNGPLAV